jgi:LemA protein
MTPLELAAAFAVGVFIAVAVFLLFTTYNDVVALRLRIDKAWANIDVVLKQRHDQLPNLVEAVRQVMTWEQDVLVDVTRARAAYVPGSPIPQQAVTSEATSAAVRSLFATVERYPEVRSAANVMDLQDEIERLEGLIADRRELYNDQVYRYNTRIGQVPAILLAGLLGWRARPFFTASEDERARPATDLGTEPPEPADATDGGAAGGS